MYTEAGRHSFWLRGYAENKVKEDRIITNGGVKVIDYSSFKNTVQLAVHEISQKSLGPIEMGTILRRHWNGLKEPTTQHLAWRAANKNKKARQT